MTGKTAIINFILKSSEKGWMKKKKDREKKKRKQKIPETELHYQAYKLYPPEWELDRHCSFNWFLGPGGIPHSHGFL